MESRRPTTPKSWPWLLAMVATSTPADLRAVRADGGARKGKSLGAGVPRSVMAVSRFTTARSARPSTPATGPKVVAGFAARPGAVAAAAGGQQQRRQGQGDDHMAARGNGGVEGRRGHGVLQGRALREAPPRVARRDPPCQRGSA